MQLLAMGHGALGPLLPHHHNRPAPLSPATQALRKTLQLLPLLLRPGLPKPICCTAPQAPQLTLSVSPHPGPAIRTPSSLSTKLPVCLPSCQIARHDDVVWACQFSVHLELALA